MSIGIDAELKNQFLAELTELTKKHGIAIGGCGCCGSPWITSDVDVGDDQSGYCVDEYGDNLTWIESKGETR